MGNCSHKGVTATGESHHSIRILTDSGALLQFKAPKSVGQVLQHYPGYGIFLQGHRASSPLPDQENLSYGLFYYLLPLRNSVSEQVQVGRTEEAERTNEKSMGAAAASNNVESFPNGSAFQVLPSAGDGIWRVKLVMDTRQLEEILSEQVNTEALIEKMRMAATASSTSPARGHTMTASACSWRPGWKPNLFNDAKSIKSTTVD
ncbi:hypothetical protein L6164_028344 [Bauhinia variegata]|uniref:Uncharacterized protein n=1 Tax=Bauhinia variegata TaxID=167791 RepID=A0ACB9LXF7_BAUVA|nr:hypothetical protein L6164_028344 [Bauhinia variegata]